MHLPSFMYFFVKMGGLIFGRFNIDESSTIKALKNCTTPILVVKKDGSRQTFDRNKIKSGIVKACDKLKISNEQIEQLIDDIEKELYNISDTEINSVQIGEMVMQRLKKLDEVAYVRFASVYRQFTDLTNFVELLSDFQNKNTSK